MSFYSQELVEEIRSRSDIVDVINSYVRLQRKGSNYVGVCPFHNDHSPSMSVNQPIISPYAVLLFGVYGSAGLFSVD